MLPALVAGLKSKGAFSLLQHASCLPETLGASFTRSFTRTSNPVLASYSKEPLFVTWGYDPFELPDKKKKKDDSAAVKVEYLGPPKPVEQELYRPLKTYTDRLTGEEPLPPGMRWSHELMYLERLAPPQYTCDLNRREFMTMLPLFICMFFLGIQPGIIFDTALGAEYYYLVLQNGPQS